MIRKVFNWMMMTAMVCSLSMGVSSCSDDDDLTEDEQRAKDSDPYGKGTDEGTEFWTVMSQLAGLQSLPDNWRTATFEPTIGEASETNAVERIVMTDDVEQAAMRYAQLIGLNESIGDVATYSYSSKAVGTLNYTRTSGSSLATVDVDIKQMPKLKRIVYMTPEQRGNNVGNYTRCYYRFGDVVSKVRKEDGKKEYWICVRPAFEPAGKDKSHWISISDVPKSNVYEWTRSDGQKVQLPTSIATNWEHVRNFAEMTYAILHPAEYFQNLGENKVKNVFQGFSADRGYHNQNFWTRVNNGWDQQKYGENGNKTMYELLFNMTENELDELTEINLWCKGYSWIMGSSGTLYYYTFSGANWRTEKWNKPSLNFKDTSKPAFNIHNYGQKGYDENWEPNHAFVVRYATGAELSEGAKYNTKTKLSNCEDVYVYNQFYGFTDMNVAPEESEPLKVESFKDRSYFVYGDVVKDADGDKWICVQPSDPTEAFGEKYSYFISFDKVHTSSLDALPSKNLAAQIMFNMVHLYDNYRSYIINNNQSIVGEQAKLSLENMVANANYSFKESVAERDSIYGRGYFVNAIYKDTDGKPYILRLVVDHTEKAGFLDNEYYYLFQEYYSDKKMSDKKMEPMDVNSQETINQYNKNSWVLRPFKVVDGSKKNFTTYATHGYLSTAQNNVGYNYYYYAPGKPFWSYKNTTNLYREPVMFFNVKRVVDTGVRPTSFEDGTAMTFDKVLSSREKKVPYGSDWKNTLYITYNELKDNCFFLNGATTTDAFEKNWVFGMNNKK